MGSGTTVADQNDEISLTGIRGACRFYGGVKSVAIAAGCQPSNLTRWLKGRASLPAKHIESILDVLDLPCGRPRNGNVLHWRYNVHWQDMKDALYLYFPSGAEVSSTPWSRGGLTNALKFLTLEQIRSDKPPEIYLFKSKGVRAVLRQPPGFLLYEDMLGEGFCMTTETGEAREFLIESNENTWFRGEVTMEMFDRAFRDDDVGWDRIIEVANKKGIKRKKIQAWLLSQ